MIGIKTGRGPAKRRKHCQELEDLRAAHTAGTGPAPDVCAVCWNQICTNLSCVRCMNRKCKDCVWRVQG